VALKEFVELDQILFGSDLSSLPASLTGMETEAIDKLPMLTEVERPGIIRDNSLALFPRFPQAILPEAHRPERLKRAAQARSEVAADDARNR